MPACAIEREHQLAAQALPKRVLRDERLQLADELLVAAKREIGVDTVGERRQVNLLESPDLRLRKGLVGEIRERRSAPEREGFEKRPCRQPRTPRAQDPSALLDQPLESIGVELVPPHTKEIAGGPGNQHVLGVARGAPSSERLSQLGDVHLHDLHGPRRRPPGPELLDQTIDRDDLVSVQQQDGQQHPLFAAAERKPTPVGPDLERPEDPKLHLSSEA